MALGWFAAGAIEGTDGFFACDTGVLVVELGIVRDVGAGRAVVDLVEAARDVRGVALGAESAVVREEVRGRFAVVLVGAMVDLRSVAAVFPGDDLVATVEERVVRRAAGFLFSSPDVMDDRSGSASDVVDLEVNAVLLAAVPGAGRVGGLLRPDATVLVRALELVVVRDAVVEGRVAVEDVDAAGRRAPNVVAPPAGRRGGTLSGLEGPVDAILFRWRAVVGEAVGVELFGGGASTADVSAGVGGAGASPVTVPFGGSAMAGRCSWLAWTLKSRVL